MARCPYCDAEYTPGEIYCKSCNEDLSALDLQPVSAAPEPAESVPVFAPPLQPTARPAAPAVEMSSSDALADLPAVPPVPLAPSAIQAPVTHAPASGKGEP